jgi:hypothetical protein
MTAQACAVPLRIDEGISQRCQVVLRFRKTTVQRYAVLLLKRKRGVTECANDYRTMNNRKKAQTGQHDAQCDRFKAKKLTMNRPASGPIL